MSGSVLRLVIVVTAMLPTVGRAQYQFVNWESPHVHPLDITPDGATLLCVNTADHRLEFFDITTGISIHAGSIPVGLDPVSVRARSASEIWVVNHVSDTISIVDLNTGHVNRTLDTPDEPSDVIFAGNPPRAFVSCAQVNRVAIFDLADLDADPIEIVLAGEDPRALAVSPDGMRVYAAIFESGNATTILGGGSILGGSFPPNAVNDLNGPYGGLNPPHNDGDGFEPAFNRELPAPPGVGLIVRKTPSGSWFDDNGGDWTALVSGSDAELSGRPVGWDLPDHDVAIIDTDTLTVTYADGLMNMCMAMAINPANGAITVVGTDAINDVRYEPNVNGRFIRVQAALVDAVDPTTHELVDLNAHLTYDAPTIPQIERDRSVGDPRGVVWNDTGTRAYVTGMGSNNVIVIDTTGARAGLQPTIEVGEGPTGIVFDAENDRLYVLNKFEGSISVIDTITEMETARVLFFDPTPAAIRQGRRHLYDTHDTSGLGHSSCASCHVDARTDRLAWDLGDPSGAMRPFNQNCNGGVSEDCADWHPMKGPMTTQTLQDIIGKEPLHWRGDRDGIEDFNGAFQSVLGDDEVLTALEMQQFEDFLATITYPPNPFRNFDNSLPAHLQLTGHYTTGFDAPAGQPLPIGNAQNGLAFFRTAGLVGVDCVACHTLPTGIGSNYTMVDDAFEPMTAGPNGEMHHSVIPLSGSTNATMKTPQLRNLHEKVGFDMTQTKNLAGFGFTHDGAVDSLARFVTQPMFAPQSDQDVADLVAFLLSFSGSDLPTGTPDDPEELPGPPSLDTHAAVGTQVTVTGTASTAQLEIIQRMLQLADSGAVELMVKGRQDGLNRGYLYAGAGVFQSDRQAERPTAQALIESAAPFSALTWTLIPVETGHRSAIDRDSDGALDRDELDDCSDPSDGSMVPPQCPGCMDADHDGYGIGSACLGSDCVDNDNSVHSGAREVCGDGIDNNCNGLIDDDDPGVLAGCADSNEDGIRDDNCQWWECAAGACAATAIHFADMGGQFGSCEPDGTADGNDRFHALNCFSNTDVDVGTGYPCEPSAPFALNVDAGGPFGACLPDGVCDGNDAFHALNAFAGATACACPLDGPAPQLNGKGNPVVIDHTALRVASATHMISSGSTVAVDVIMTSAVRDLRGYQLHLEASGGRSGTLELIDIVVPADNPLGSSAPDSPHPSIRHTPGDRGRKQANAPAAPPYWTAFNRVTQQMVAGRDDNGVPTPSEARLATFIYRASDDARGTFVVEVLHEETDHRTFLFASPYNGMIAIDHVTPARISVTPLR